MNVHVAPEATAVVGASESDEMSDAEFGALEFKPWPGMPDMAAYGPAINDHVAYVRMSYLTMFKTKEEIVAFAKDEPELFMKLAENMDDSSKALDEMAVLCRAANSRMLCACAAMLNSVGALDEAAS